MSSHEAAGHGRESKAPLTPERIAEQQATLFTLRGEIQQGLFRSGIVETALTMLVEQGDTLPFDPEAFTENPANTDTIATIWRTNTTAAQRDLPAERLEVAFHTKTWNRNTTRCVPVAERLHNVVLPVGDFTDEQADFMATVAEHLDSLRVSEGPLSQLSWNFYTIIDPFKDSARIPATYHALNRLRRQQELLANLHERHDHIFEDMRISDMFIDFQTEKLADDSRRQNTPATFVRARIRGELESYKAHDPSLRLIPYRTSRNSLNEVGFGLRLVIIDSTTKMPLRTVASMPVGSHEDGDITLMNGCTTDQAHIVLEALQEVEKLEQQQLLPDLSVMATKIRGGRA